MLFDKGLLTASSGNLFLSSKFKLVEYLGYTNKFNKDTKDVRFNSLRIKKDVLYGQHTICDNDGEVINLYNGVHKEGVVIYDTHNIKYWNKNNFISKQIKEEKEQFKCILYAYKIDNNFKQQEYIYKDKLSRKVLNNKITEKQADLTSTNKKAFKLAKQEVEKNLDTMILDDNYRVKLLLNNCSDEQVNKHHNVILRNRNTTVTLSRKGIAKQCGFKSKSTGTRIIDKLKRKNLIDSDTRNEYHFNDGGMLYEDILSNKNINKLGRVIYSVKSSSTKLILSNTIKLNKYMLEHSFLSFSFVNTATSY